MSDESPFTNLLELLGPRVDNCHIDPPSGPEGAWWADLAIDGISTQLAWREGHGFGLYATGNDGYGTGPDEVIQDPALAAKRLLQLAVAS